MILVIIVSSVLVTASTSMVVGALGRVAISVLFATGGALVLLRVLPHLPDGHRFAVKAGLKGVDQRARSALPCRGGTLSES